jgi:hydrogenase maturation protein HypF
LNLVGRRIRVRGLVQGVGFRPFVWRLAQQLGLSGWVRNDASGVDIGVQGQATRMAEFLQRLGSEAPVLARVDAIEVQHDSINDSAGFTILASVEGRANTAIGPDVAVCGDCLEELFDPTQRRWRHAFITCTHCGPRYSVTHALPYDRPQTSLAPFPLCPDCAREYTAPADRRFHAETTCCPHCGPQLSLRDARGQCIDGDPITRTLNLLQAGAIVAIKGLGGFHLACDARNAEAVQSLRWRKNREAKPFAVMTANAASLAPYARISPDEQTWLESRERPVLLLRTLNSCDSVLPAVAPGLLELGVMLPTTPIHYLLFHEAAGRPIGSQWLAAAQGLVLVMTSANPGGEPIVRDSAEASARLVGIADAVLDHDRAIAARCDDSVLRPLGSSAQFLRRSRGYAPSALRLARSGAAVLAFGAHLKNTVCVSRGNELFASPHVGDLDSAASCAFQDETVRRLLALAEVEPEIVAHDLHPNDYSTQAALAFATKHQLPTIAVQHHHAHIAAVCAEHAHDDALLGLALDGVGLGSDAQAWGGELLWVHGAQFKRLGHLRPLPLPGADKAAREPWRMAAAVLHELGRNQEISARFQAQSGADVLSRMLAQKVNCPRSSSMGRVFDAAAGLLGLSERLQYEAQAAILLEQAATRHIEQHGWPEPLAGGWVINAERQLDLLPLLAALEAATDVDHAAAQFHATLVAALSEWVLQAALANGLRTLAWGGGCFLNTLLSLGLRQNLEKHDLRLLSPQRFSAGDASIAVGQAWIALKSLEQ